VTTASSDTIGSIEAEAAVLGAVLRLPAAAARPVVDMLEIEDLTDPRYRAVLVAAQSLLGTDVPADAVTVLGELRRTGVEKCFTADRSAGLFLLDLDRAAPAPTCAGHYARVVMEHRARRRVAEAGQRLQQAAGTSALVDLRALATAEWTEVFRQLDRAGVPS